MTESLTLDERVKGQNGLPATRAPSHAGVLEPFGDQSLAGCSTTPELMGRPLALASA